MIGSDNQQNKRDKRAQAGLRASYIGLFVNIVLAVSKIVLGSLSGSVSILGDGFNNLSDTGSVLISYFSLRMAAKPGDKDHPFGHGRMEYLGALGIALLILYIGIDLIKKSILAIQSPDRPMFTWLIFAITAAGVPVKFLLWRYYRVQGKRFDMATLRAAAQDSINDVIITSSVLLGMLVSHLFDLTLDGWLGLLVAAFILFGGIKIIKETVDDLLGGPPDRELGFKVLEILKRYPEILGVHDFVLHNYGPGKSMASIHAEVEASASLLEIHEVVDRAEQEVLAKLALPLVIHMDPVLPDDEPGQTRKALLSAYLADMSPPLRLHDFRVVPGKRIIKLIFDIEVPIDFEGEEALIQQVSTYAKTLDVRHHCVIGIDKDYFSEPSLSNGTKNTNA